MRIILFILLIVSTVHAQTRDGKIEFVSSDTVLVNGFKWAKMQALSYVHRGNDAVGHWYEAALPNRQAFCMRDVSHQAIGASVLGLSDINKNLLTHFVKSISESKQWCGYWEIDKYDRPAPVDYKSDADFWYNLPANFDLMNAIFRQYLWTGDAIYLNDLSFKEFFARSCADYVNAWDFNKDGIMEGTKGKIHYRGIGSYNEDKFGETGNDLVAAQIIGYRSYQKILALTGDSKGSNLYSAKAEKIERYLNETWWDKKEQVYRQGLQQNGEWVRNDPYQLFLLRWDCVPQNKLLPVLSSLHQAEGSMNVEMLSYLPLESFRHGDPSIGVNLLKRLTSPSLNRREYPEVSFAALEAYVVGLMGLIPDASSKSITTFNRLNKQVSFARLNHVPVFDGEIDVEHSGVDKTTFVNNTKSIIHWKACFYSVKNVIRINGKRIKEQRGLDLKGESFLYAQVNIHPGKTVTIETDEGR